MIVGEVGAGVQGWHAGIIALATLGCTRYTVDMSAAQLIDQYYLVIKVTHPAGLRMFYYEVFREWHGLPWLVRCGNTFTTEEEAKTAGAAALRWFRDGSAS
jgi:hypothetical protein